MAIFGIFEDKKTKEELKEVKERNLQLEKELEESKKSNYSLNDLVAKLNEEITNLKKENEELKQANTESAKKTRKKRILKKTNKTVKKGEVKKAYFELKAAPETRDVQVKADVATEADNKPKRRGREPKNVDVKTASEKPVKADKKKAATDDKPKTAKKRSRKSQVAEKATLADAEQKHESEVITTNPEPVEAAVMGIDEYENYDAIKSSKPASKPKRKYTLGKPVDVSEAGANASKSQKIAGGVKAVKPGKIESYADMLAITQSENKNNKQ